MLGYIKHAISGYVYLQPSPDALASEKHPFKSIAALSRN